MEREKPIAFCFPVPPLEQRLVWRGGDSSTRCPIDRDNKQLWSKSLITMAIPCWSVVRLLSMTRFNSSERMARPENEHLTVNPLANFGGPHLLLSSVTGQSTAERGHRGSK